MTTEIPGRLQIIHSNLCICLVNSRLTSYTMTLGLTRNSARLTDQRSSRIAVVIARLLPRSATLRAARAVLPRQVVPSVCLSVRPSVCLSVCL